MTDPAIGPGPGRSAERRSWLPIALVGAVIVVGLAVAVLTRPDSFVCSTAATPHSPLLSTAGMAQQPDARLDTLGKAVNRWGQPFGPVLAGVGFDYGQWLHLYGVGDGLLAFTKDNAAVTMLAGSSLKPVWALDPTSKRIAWDASATRFALLDLESAQHSRLATYDLATGKEQWCVSLNSQHRAGQPVSTAFVGADLVVALPSSDGLQLAKVEGGTGRVTWSVSAKNAARADYLGPLDAKTVIAGGVEEYRLAEPPPTGPGGAAVAAYAVGDGKEQWSWKVPKATIVHVVGVEPGTGAEGDRVIIAMRSGMTPALVALDAKGKQVWSRPQPGSLSFESTLRSGVVMVHDVTTLTGYDARTGQRLWTRPVPTRPTYFPYGFTLDQMPSLDADHVLMPTTTALQVLDVRTGKDVAYPLPTDGVNTTYWPYQLVVTDKLFAIVTNTGGLVVGRG